MNTELSINLSEFTLLESHNGRKSFYNKNYYQNKEYGYIIFIDSDDEGWNDVFLVEKELIHIVSGYIEDDVLCGTFKQFLS